MDIDNVQVETMLITWPEIERLHRYLQEAGGALVLRDFMECDGHRYVIFTTPGYQVAAQIDFVCDIVRGK